MTGKNWVTLGVGWQGPVNLGVGQPGCSQARLGTAWAPESGSKMHRARNSPTALGKPESCTGKALGAP